MDEKSFKKNYASDQSVADKFMEYVAPIIKRTRENRRQVDAKWIEDTRAWSCVLDNMGYVGRSNMFVPELHNQVETTTEKLVSNIVSAPDLIHCVAMPGTDQKTADNIRDSVAYELEVKNKVISLMDEFERQNVLLGTSVVKGVFEKQLREVFYKDPKSKKVKRKEVPTRMGTYWHVPSMFRWYIYPEFSSLDKYEVIFEDRLTSKQALSRQKDKYHGLDEVQGGLHDLEYYWVDLEILEMVELSRLLDVDQNKVLLTEVYCEFEITKGNFVPVQAFIANHTKLVRLVRNPFWWQDHPYAGDVYLKRPNGLFYGFSLPDRIRSQQYQINDLTNHVMDSLSYSLSPIIGMDPALVGNVNSMKTHPGAKWLGSPEGFKFFTFPDVSGSGLRAVQEVRGQVAQFSDNSPGLAPQLEGKARSATQASIVQQSVSVRQKVQGTRREENVMVQMCKKTHIMQCQFMDDKWVIRLHGPDKGSWSVKEIRPDDIVGDVSWIWKGSSYVEKTAVRSQQLLAFFGQAMQIATLMPGEVDLPGLFRRIAREAFDLSDVDEIFKSLREQKTIDPEIENIALEQERDVPIHNGDDDEDHIDQHDALLDKKGLSQDAKLKVINHIEKHREQLNAKKAVVDLRSKLSALKEMSGQGGPEGPEINFEEPQEGAPQRPPSPMEGNRQQISSTPEMGDLMTGVKGIK